jgi:hypothetical protein
MLTAPLRALLWVFSEVAEQAERQLHDVDGLTRELTELHRSLESGAVTEEEFVAREEQLAARLSRAEEYNRRRARRA